MYDFLLPGVCSANCGLAEYLGMSEYDEYKKIKSPGLAQAIYNPGKCTCRFGFIWDY
jgi:hypothetical protein